MTKQEFTERTEINPTDEKYADIEKLYYKVSMDKDEFCRDFKKIYSTKLFKEIVAEMWIQANCAADFFETDKKVAGELLDDYSKSGDLQLRECAKKLLGLNAMTVQLLERGLPLAEDEMQYVRLKLQ